MRPALSDYRHLASGRYARLYRIDDDHLLFVATDRISAFDFILDSAIPDKGRILTAMSVFFSAWCRRPITSPDRRTIRDPRRVLGLPARGATPDMVPIRVRRPRLYLTGSGLLDYQRTGAVCGIDLPPGLVEASSSMSPSSPRPPRLSSAPTTRTSRSPAPPNWSAPPGQTNCDT